MSVEAIGAIFVGLSAVITAIGGLLAARSRRLNADSRELKLLRKEYRVARRHMFRLEVLLESNGIDVPEHPNGLDSDDDDDAKARQ